jgi:hypothetical protein
MVKPGYNPSHFCFETGGLFTFLLRSHFRAFNLIASQMGFFTFLVCKRYPELLRRTPSYSLTGASWFEKNGF